MRVHRWTYGVLPAPALAIALAGLILAGVHPTLADRLFWPARLDIPLDDLGPTALRGERAVKISTTCTVFAGAELRDRLALGQRREDILGGLHRAIMLRAMSLLSRSGGIHDEFTFTGGVAKNEAMVSCLNARLDAPVNVGDESHYMGALGAALFALDRIMTSRAPAEIGGVQ